MPMMDKAAPPTRQAVSTSLFEALDQLTIASMMTLVVEMR